MKALSIQEPWISLIAERKKTIETRTWKTNYKRLILLCGSAKPIGRYSGKASCVAELIDCREMTPEDEVNACCMLYPNANSWILKNVKILPEPFELKGQLGLFEVGLEITNEVMRQIKHIPI